MKTIKSIQLFETYNEEYQPYISHFMGVFRRESSNDVSIMAYNNSVDSTVIVLPNFRMRQLFERWYAIRHVGPSKLNFVERLCIKQHVDIIHLQQSYLFSKVLGLLQRPTHMRPKIVITLRGGDTYIKPWESKKWNDFYTNYGNKVDAFIVMSQHQKIYLKEKWGVNPSRVHVIPISFGEKFEVKAKLPNLNTMKIASAFRMCWEKNIEGNLHTVKILKEKGIPVQYDIYGGGPDSGQVHYFIDKYQLHDCVTYHGRIENSILKDKLLEIDFYLQLSHSESLGMSVIEAQSLGIPAIISNAGGLPEVIENGKSGFCVSPMDSQGAADCIEELWRDKDRYVSFSKAAINHSHFKFSISNEVLLTNALYHELVF